MSLLALVLSTAALAGTPNADVNWRTCSGASPIGAASAIPLSSKACKPDLAGPITNPLPRPEAPSSGGGAKPEATPTPKPGTTPAPTPEATPTPVTHPSRTNVDLTDTDVWSVRPSYRILAAGPIDFNVNNRGEDDHNLTVRDGTRDLGKLDLAPGETGTLTVALAAGSYTLYCSLPQHEEAGMKATISVR